MNHHHARRHALTGLLLIAVLAIGGCAAKLPKLAVCDGKHRRDANPYGTVLPGAPAAVPSIPSGTKGGEGQVPPAPPPAKTSARALSSASASC